jgi:hypothetical protein
MLNKNVTWEDDSVVVHGYDVIVGHDPLTHQWYAARTKSPIFCLPAETRGDALLKASLALGPLAVTR